MNIEDRIKRWREQDRDAEEETDIELLVDAEEELRRMRAAYRSLAAAVIRAFGRGIGRLRAQDLLSRSLWRGRP